jgi:DNA-binding beta-propeller fold protein YncE
MRVIFGAMFLALLVVFGAWLMGVDQTVAAQGRGGAGAAPRYTVQPLWPRPFPDDSWVIGSVTGLAVDSQNHVWVSHRGFASLEANERGMMNNPPTSSVCCFAAPYVIEYDANGQYLGGWGGPNSAGGYVWPQNPAGLIVDPKGNVYIAAAGLEPPPAGRGRGGAPPADAAGRGRGGPPAPPPPPADAHVLKFDRLGRHQLTIGTPGKMDGPDSQTTLNRPRGLAYDPAANELFVADTGNRRIVVFDADKGTYKRHWGAYGEKSAGTAPGPFQAGETAPKAFREPTCVEIARDGNVYVCDKTSNRIQVFDKSGKFIREGMVAASTGGGVVNASSGGLNMGGSVWDIAFSNDQGQQYLFVADGHNKKVRILRRESLQEVGTIGSGGRYPGQFLAVNVVAVDGQGNLYTGEEHHGKRVQKFAPAR